MKKMFSVRNDRSVGLVYVPKWFVNGVACSSLAATQEVAVRISPTAPAQVSVVDLPCLPGSCCIAKNGQFPQCLPPN